jgi:hypothetical protein
LKKILLVKIQLGIKNPKEDAYQAFFDNAKIDENNSLEYVSPEDFSTTDEKSFFSENTYQVFNVLRQLFIFLPSAFLLFFASISLTARLIFPMPENVLKVSFIQLILMLILALMTILGLGDLRNPKHLSIPLSIISVGVILGIIGTIFFDWYEFGYFIRNYVPYFLPLAFIAPILARNWADSWEDE